jgi:2-oxoacid:acceptor oxidoreductase gamma subunit (pyruvate/2-ketoisovalerate family)
MIEIRFHGRGGQGAVIASKIMACALFKEGKYVQSFPKFGVERRGAPVEAFLRIDDEKILIRNNVYTPHHLVVLDQTLIDAIDVTQGLHENGWIIINTTKKPADFPKLSERFKVGCVDAGAIAVKYKLGSKASPIVNTSILGSFVRCTNLAKLESVTQAIMEEAPIKPDANAKAAEEAFASTIV